MKNFSPDELAQADGTHDSATLVAVNGKVYDISASKKWIRGKHMNRHSAGKDLSAEILAAPHDSGSSWNDLKLSGVMSKLGRSRPSGLKENLMLGCRTIHSSGDIRIQR